MSAEPTFSELHQALISCYDLEEFRTLCAQLGVSFDDLRGEGRQAKTRELILWMQRHGRLDELWATISSALQEHDKLQAKVPGEPPQQLPDLGAQLGEIDTKMDVLLAGQTTMQGDMGALRQTLLDCYETGEQAIITAVAKRLDHAQLTTVQAVLDALEADRLPETEMHQVLDAVQQMLAALQQCSVSLPAQQRVAEAIAAPMLDVKHKLKVTLPIIPMLLGYEGELDLSSGVNLKTLWGRLVKRAAKEK